MKIFRSSQSFARVQRRAQCGFSLAEMMVSVAMLAVVAISLYGGISYGFASITLARQNLRATQIVLEKMEIIRMYSWDQVNSNGFVPTTFTASYYPDATGSNASGGLTYYGTTSISNVTLTASYTNDMRLVTVNVYWTNRNTPQTVQMSTYISQYGLARYIY